VVNVGRFGGVLEGLGDVFAFEIGILGEDLVEGRPASDDECPAGAAVPLGLGV
jgi:hypothetical protein